MTATLKMSERGTVTLPKVMRQQLAGGNERLLVAESTDQGILLRPAAVFPIELYSEERIAEFEAANNQAIEDIFPDKSSSVGA